MKAKRSSSGKNWSLLVYFGGDNNLSEEMVWGLQEMRKSACASSIADAVNVVALFDPRGESPRCYEILTPELRPTKPFDGELETSPAPPAGVEPGTVAEILERFLTEGVEKLPASRYAVVLSGHGSGAVGDFLPDDDPAIALSIPRLAKILEHTREAVGAAIDVVGMDSCQMSTVEVGFEIRGSVRFLVASEGLVLNAGWPYHRVLEVLAGNDGSSAAEAARSIAARYLAFYRDYEVAGLSTDIAVTDLGKVEPLADRLRDLADALAEPLGHLAQDGIEEAFELGELERLAQDDEADSARAIRDAVVLAHWSAQSYKCDRYVDLLDFSEQLLRFGRGWSENDATERIREAVGELQPAVRETVLASGTTGVEFQHSRGLSVYFPWSSRDYFPEYRNLEFAKRTKWADFLETYLKATLRVRRLQGSHLEVAKTGKAVARDARGREVLPAPPHRRPQGSLVAARDVEAGTHRDVEAGTHRDVEAGTHRDVEAGTHRGKICASTRTNPPEGHYDATRLSERGSRPRT